MDRPRYESILEEIVLDVLLTEGFGPERIFNIMKIKCPGNFEMTSSFKDLFPRNESLKLDSTFCVDCDVFGIQLRFPDICSQTEWLLKFS